MTWLGTHLAQAAIILACSASHAFAALPEGANAPDFQLQAALAGKPMTFSLSKALRQGPVVLYFFPAAFTQGCTVEAHEFAEATDDFKKLNATLRSRDGAGQASELICKAVCSCPRSHPSAPASTPGASARRQENHPRPSVSAEAAARWDMPAPHAAATPPA
ncbi:MAG: redoxin domain-containing protein [Massilia sp.]